MLRFHTNLLSHRKAGKPSFCCAFYCNDFAQFQFYATKPLTGKMLRSTHIYTTCVYSARFSAAEACATASHCRVVTPCGYTATFLNCKRKHAINCSHSNVAAQCAFWRQGSHTNSADESESYRQEQPCRDRHWWATNSWPEATKTTSVAL